MNPLSKETKNLFVPNLIKFLYEFSPTLTLLITCSFSSHQYFLPASVTLCWNLILRDSPCQFPQSSSSQPHLQHMHSTLQGYPGPSSPVPCHPVRNPHHSLASSMTVYFLHDSKSVLLPTYKQPPGSPTGPSSWIFPTWTHHFQQPPSHILNNQTHHFQPQATSSTTALQEMQVWLLLKL